MLSCAIFSVLVWESYHVRSHEIGRDHARSIWDHNYRLEQDDCTIFTGLVWESYHAKSREITRDHARSCEITQDHARSRKIMRDHARSCEITAHPLDPIISLSSSSRHLGLLMRAKLGRVQNSRVWAINPTAPVSLAPRDQDLTEK